MLEYNWDYNLAKIGIDEDDNLVISNEIELSQIDPSYYETIVNNVGFLTILMNYELDADLISDRNGPAIETTLDDLVYRESSFDQDLSLLNNRVTMSLTLGDWKLSADQDKDPTYDSYDYEHINGELFLRIITERGELSNDFMLTVILENVLTVDPNALLINSGVRNVNGMNFGWAVIEASFEGISFTYYNHFYTSSFGSIQIMGYTFSNLYAEYIDSIEDVVSTFRVN